MREARRNGGKSIIFLLITTIVPTFFDLLMPHIRFASMPQIFLAIIFKHTYTHTHSLPSVKSSRERESSLKARESNFYDK